MNIIIIKFLIYSQYHMTEFFMWMMQVLITNSCNSLSVTNLNMINSPKSHIHVNGFEGATFSHINISAPGDRPNMDLIQKCHDQRFYYSN